MKRHLSTLCTAVPEATDDSDHLPLLAAIEVGTIGVVPPLDLGVQSTQLEAPPKFVLPIKETQLIELQACIEDAHSLRIHELYTAHTYTQLTEALHSLADVTSA